MSVVNSNSRDAESLIDEGLNYGQNGKLEEAIPLFRKAIELNPDSARAYLNLGTSLMATRQMDEAIASFQKATDLQPDYLKAWTNLLGAHMSEKNWVASKKDLLNIIALEPDNSHYSSLLAKIYLHSSELDVAEKYFRMASEQEPGNAELLSNLAYCLDKTYRSDEALEVLEQALQIDDTCGKAHRFKGDAYFNRGEIENAEACYLKAIECDGEDFRAYATLGRMLYKAGRHDEGIRYGNKAIALAPRNPEPYIAYAEMLITNGSDLDDVLDKCHKILELQHGSRESITMMVLALHEKGDIEKYQKLTDAQTFIPSSTIQVPTSYDSLEAFNDALCEDIRNHASLSPGTSDMPIRDGYKTGDLLSPPTPAVMALEGIIRNKVIEFMAGLPDDPAHPFYGSKPEKWDLSMWGNIIKRGGEFGSHTHPSAWLSGVYYPRVPDTTPDNPQGGWIEFGRPESKYKLKNPPPVHLIESRAGTLVCFPSYMFHRTIPFDSGGERFSIAFDVIPYTDILDI